MKIKNSIFLALIFLTTGFVSAQEKPSFFVEIPDKNNVPVVTHSTDGVRVAYSKTRKRKLDRLINAYEVYSCKKAFNNSKKPSLQNIYLIECNDIQFMEKLHNRFKQFYPRVEKADGKPLFTPNDYGSTGGYTGLGSSQEDLDFIRAQEAWNITTGCSDIKIGIADTQFAVNHEDLLNTIIAVNPSENTNPHGSGNAFHGSVVAALAAANTDNEKGGSAIGYNSFIYAEADGLNITALDNLSLLIEVKVLNSSWLTYTTVDGVPSQTDIIQKNAIDDIVHVRKKVLIAAGGNGELIPGDPNLYVFPASYKGVISVSSIGHKNQVFGNTILIQTFLDKHEYLEDNEVRSFQHNDSIDIVAPGYGLFTLNPFWGNDRYNYNMMGTSLAAPIVAGTVALMFDVNYCIDPKEVETILKLTAVKIDTLPQNLQFYGKLGAGKLDAYEAVKMSKDMGDDFGIVEVKDRILYRWFYKLETAPYEIKMTNNDVTGNARLKFKARNNIEILSGDYYPGAGGYVDLSIDETIALDCSPPPSSSFRSMKSSNDKDQNSDIIFEVYPTLVNQDVTVLSKKTSLEKMSAIIVYNFFGLEVFKQDKITSNKISLNLEKLNEGIYILKVFGSKGQVLHTQKIIKK